MNRLTFILTCALLGAAVACNDGKSGGKAFFGPGSTGSVNSQGGGGGTLGGTGAFAAGPDMGLTRCYHTATLLQDGRVLVVGGVDIASTNIQNRPELYDPVANSWGFVDTLTPTAPEGRLTEQQSGNQNATARFDHTATRLANGQVLVAGGFGVERWPNGTAVAEPLRSSFLFDPTTNIFTQQSDMTTRRQLCQSALLGNQLVLVAGGIDDTANASAQTTGNSVNTAETYDPTSGTWTAVASMQGPHTQGNLVAIGNTIAFVGGADVKRRQSALQLLVGAGGPRIEVYDVTNDVWNQGSPNMFDRTEMGATVMTNGQAFFAGGFDPTNISTGVAPTDTTEIFNGQSGGTWAQGPALSSARFKTRVAEIGTSADVVIIGGTNDGQTLAPVATCDVWSVLNNALFGTIQMMTPRAGHTATTLSNGSILVTGGYVDASFNCTPTTEVHTR